MDTTEGTLSGNTPIELDAFGQVGRIALEFRWPRIFFNLAAQGSFFEQSDIVFRTQSKRMNLGVQSYAKTCTGTSGQDIACSQYFDPVEKLKVDVNGAFATVGVLW